MVIANLSNLVLDYALIYGVWGFPEWGFAGAAWATVIASIVQLVVSLAVLYQPSFDRTYKIFAWQNVRWNGEAFRRFHVLGLPSGLTWIMDILAWSVFVNYLVGSLGTVALAASNIVLQFLHISFMPAMGIGQALVGLVGQAIGEKRPEEAVRYTNLATFACMAWMGTMGLLVFVFGQKIASFVNLEAAATAGAIFKVAAIFQLFDAVAIINSSALRAAGDTHFPAWVSLVANWLVFVAGGWVVLRLFPEWGAVGPWATGTVMIIVIGLIFRWRFMARGWLKIDIFKS
jgi:MATE family multidrug resistance protein